MTDFDAMTHEQIYSVVKAGEPGAVNAVASAISGISGKISSHLDALHDLSKSVEDAWPDENGARFRAALSHTITYLTELQSTHVVTASASVAQVMSASREKLSSTQTTIPAPPAVPLAQQRQQFDQHLKATDGAMNLGLAQASTRISQAESADAKAVKLANDLANTYATEAAKLTAPPPAPARTGSGGTPSSTFASSSSSAGPAGHSTTGDLPGSPGGPVLTAPGSPKSSPGPVPVGGVSHLPGDGGVVVPAPTQPVSQVPTGPIGPGGGIGGGSPVDPGAGVGGPGWSGLGGAGLGGAAGGVGSVLGGGGAVVSTGALAASAIIAARNAAAARAAAVRATALGNAEAGELALVPGGGAGGLGGVGAGGTGVGGAGAGAGGIGEETLTPGQIAAMNAQRNGILASGQEAGLLNSERGYLGMQQRNLAGTAGGLAAEEEAQLAAGQRTVPGLLGGNAGVAGAAAARPRTPFSAGGVVGGAAERVTWLIEDRDLWSADPGVRAVIED